MEAPMLQMERTSSIEREPRTLSIDQLQSARNLAIHILSTKSIEEASRIFTEGLQPVVNAACRMGSDATRMNMDSGEEQKLMELADTSREDTAADAFRDIASAPF